MRIIKYFSFALCALMIASTASALGAGKHQAIVIGNSSYATGILKNPLNDATAVAIAAQDIGFDVALIKDAKLEVMRLQLKDKIQSAKKADILMLFFAGHGVQSGGRNYLLPVDAKIYKASELPSQAISLHEVIAWLAEADVGAAIIFLDACRNNPFPRADIAEPGLGFVEIGSRELIVSYAAASGAIAYDGSGPNSPYSTALVEALRIPDLDIYGMLRSMRGRVREITDGRQIPWASGSIERQIVLNEVSTSVADLSEEPTFSGELDDTAWKTIRTSANPAYFDQFINNFPESSHVELAVARIGALQKENRRSFAAGYSEPAPLLLGNSSIPMRDVLASQIDYCDILAASDADPLRLGPGVPLYMLEAEKAILACTDAIAKHPGEARFYYQLARALLLAERWQESARFANMAVDRGYPEGYSILAWMNAAGLGMPKNPERAIELWRIGAKLGSPIARANLGRSYRDGFGVAASISDAIYWLRLAAVTGERVAADDLGNLYRKGTGVSADFEEAAKWYYLSASLGGSNAMTTIGNLYRDGEGFDQDVKAAELWYRKAMEAGNRFAPFQFARLKLKQNEGKSSREIAKLFVLAGDRGFAEGYFRAAELYRMAKEPNRGFFYALLAAGSGFEQADGLVKALRASLSAKVAGQIEGEAALWLEQNGDFARKSTYAK